MHRANGLSGLTTKTGAGGRVLAGGLIVLMTVTGCGQGQAETAPRYSVAEVQRRDLAITAEATGQLGPLQLVEVKSLASGTVVEVLVDVGETVEPGTLLARVDPRDVQNDYEQAAADFEVAEERFRNSEAQLRRSENLLAAGVITEQEHEGRTLDFANARASLIRARTNRDLAELRLQDVTIRARMPGTVIERLVEEGGVIQSAAGNVSGGTVLFKVANLNVMEVRTLVDETDVGRIQADMPVHVVVDAFPDRTFEGKVEKIEPQAVVQSNVVNYPVIVHLQNEDGILKPGMSVEVTVLLAERPNTLTLPNNAIVSFQELRAAGSVLGVPENQLTMERSVYQELMRELNTQRSAGQDRGQAGADDPDAPPAGPDTRRQAAAGAGAGGVRQGAGAAGMTPQGRTARPATQQDAIRQGIVFVVSDDGLTVTPRAVLIGVNDWNNSEILAGVEEGEQVALIGGAQLQAAREQSAQMMRNRMGGGMPFGR
jgi:HlyD family secretion protein